MKPHSGFLSFCLLLAVILLSSPLQAADIFLVDIHLNSAVSPSLSFGETDTDIVLTDLFPAPPFSGMFGVVDVYFENTHPTFKDTAWYDRLSTDRKEQAAGNKWVLIANSKAKLTFKQKTGSIPANMKIAWWDVKTESVKSEAIVADTSLYVKPSTVYTIQVIDTPLTESDLETSTNTTTAYSQKVDGELTPITFNFNPPGDEAASDTYILRLSFNAGNNLIRFKGEDKPDALWEVEFVAPGYTSGYAWDVEDPSILIVTLTKNPTREAGTWQISLNPVKTSASPIEVTETNGVLDGTTRRGIVLKLGTLDFDGDGVITLDDATYFYNYMSLGGAKNPRIKASNLMKFTESATADDAALALEFFINNIDESNFDDGASGTLLDDATYFYNYMSLGGAKNPRIKASNLMKFTESATADDAAIALDKLKELATE